MKILVTSDTHGYYSPISDYILEHDEIDLLIHAGDGVDDVKSIAYETNIPYYVVKGNNDFGTEAYDKFIDKGRNKIFLTHGHTHNIYSGYDEIAKIARDNSCNIAIYGHTHKYLCEKLDDLIILNPGSISLPRDNNMGFMIMELTDNGVDLTRVKLN